MNSRSFVPETRLSLLLRVSDPADQAAWEEFVELYQAVIYRTARYRGLQDADAQDVTQQVLVSVAQSLQQRPHDPSRARFRTWLATVARNTAIDVLRARTRECGTGDSGVQRQLNEVADRQNPAELLDQEYQKEIFRRAAQAIEPEFEPDTWQAFWQTTVLQRPIAEVAQQLGKQPGSIYAARSRVTRRLREEVTRMDDSVTL
ncbi:MAG: sigma-70 family RNA polymerase sigma factor, partial [Pirellulales bacterium]|nr:sigma-70 family RNA polymerase sigma factor [Pirellulales bacterium]